MAEHMPANGKRRKPGFRTIIRGYCLAVTQEYLADVRKPGEAKKAVADADFIPKPRVVKTGTAGD